MFLIQKGEEIKEGDDFGQGERINWPDRGPEYVLIEPVARVEAEWGTVAETGGVIMSEAVPGEVLITEVIVRWVEQPDPFLSPTRW